MLFHTSSYEDEAQRKSNNDISDKDHVSNPDNDKRQRQRLSFDDVFQKPQNKNKLLTLNVKGPTRQSFIPYGDNQIKMRNTPSDLCCALEGLSDAQVSAITDMGFQSILSMDIHDIQPHFGYWLLVNYDHKRSELNVGSRRIKITPSMVHEVFGIPMGKINVVEKNNPRQEGIHPIVDRFRMQFHHEKISVRDVVEKLKANTNGGRRFKLNFLVIFNTILGKTTTGATVNQKFLASIGKYSDICSMNWCSYVITCLNRTKEKWNVKDKYNGPLTFLAVLYAHEYELRHGKIQDPAALTPAISYISTKHLFDMEKFVHDNGQLYDDNIEADEPQTKSCNKPQIKSCYKFYRKSCNEDVGEMQTKSLNEASGVQTVYRCAKVINLDDSEQEDEGECKDGNKNQLQSEYEDQGDKFQSKEDQHKPQGEEENHATQSKHHCLNLQKPVGTYVKRESDDCITPPSLQSLSGMSGFLGRSGVTEKPVDANLRDDDNEELLDPKQDKRELNDDVPPTSDPLAKLSSSQSDIICVQGYKVKQSNATILETIFKKHGDIAANCIFKTDSVRSSFLEVVCEVVRRIQIDDVIEKMEEIECQVSDAEAANINVSWLRAHFETIDRMKATIKKYSLLIETKSNAILVRRAAQMDLSETSVELMAAQRRFQKAERCVQVLHLVEKNLNDSILESKGKMDSFLNHPVV
ncbi:hypothetical protein QVD17_34898 [Tagetes erecta]|uniref:Phospholipase-like protein n=1 Tax=Tagetes erecta TaxID=13708 RepID=A0AAD8NLV1_TARER|nr:hypothetical protein QVD17_34898 [Tagetes erecta]